MGCQRPGSRLNVWHCFSHLGKKTRLSSRQARINKPRSCLIWGTVLVPDGNFFWATKNTLSIHPEARPDSALMLPLVSVCLWILRLSCALIFRAGAEGWKHLCLQQCGKANENEPPGSSPCRSRVVQILLDLLPRNWEGCMVYHGPLPIEMDDLAVPSL